MTVQTSQNPEKTVGTGILLVSYKFKMAGKNNRKMVKKASLRSFKND
jgi:hypothetical protein